MTFQLDPINEVKDYLKGISLRNPYCHQIFHLHEFISNARKQLKLAKQYLNDVLAINPSRFPTLVQLRKL